MKLLKLVLFMVLLLFVGTIGGCLEEYQGTVDTKSIDYSLSDISHLNA